LRAAGEVKLNSTVAGPLRAYSKTRLLNLFLALSLNKKRDEQESRPYSEVFVGQAR
jgi:hypothetical protein